MKRAELVFLPSPGLSHLVSTVETAKLLLDRDRDREDRLAITVLIMKLPNDASVDSFTQKITYSPRLRLLNLPGLNEDDPNAAPHLGIPHAFIEKQTPYVRETISDLIKGSSSSQIAGLVLDVFCTKFIEIARELGLPSYIFLTASVTGLGVPQPLAEMRFQRNQQLTELRNSDVELSVVSYTTPIPAKILPAEFTRGGPAADDFLNCFKRIWETNGIVANTFYDLESYAIESLMSAGKSPKIYPVGPILNQSSQSFGGDDDVKKWLDHQPENSVVFLCFGTLGRLDDAQVREFALALENSGFRFLWSLRKPAAKGARFVSEYENFQQVLPEGFLERTEGIGKVIGWAPQMAALSHPAVGGFVSHCGWNSTLESVWFGVPIATFPLYAEQQLNAFQLVKELGMAEMIRLDYKIEFGGEAPPEIVGWEEIAAAIKRLMAAEGVRQKVKEMQKKARAALLEGGSSYNALNLFIEDVITSIA
ncbi:hypothetical protein C2S53_009611 [Perilla frutescens var. hirtella]|uniref:Glycosyltransferase n=1 Tax=Perilla frutescens var. hirtella TaxID=608512 RepID=A0AAD4JPS2_PERFH|nr:hypothetical protein C2S53_009611 [Perilla frutescens var. hirtella]